MDTLKGYKILENYYSKLVLLLTRGVHFLYKLVEPKSKDEDDKRREFILNILLLGSIAFSAVGNIIALIDLMILGSSYRGSPLNVLLLIFFIFLGLYLLSRRGFFVVSSYILAGIYFISGSYMLYTWGVDLPVALLICVLAIVMSGILINTRFAFISTLIISSIILLLTYFQINQIISPDLYWKKELTSGNDMAIIVFILGVIMIVSWLSNREIEKSLNRARRSEKELAKERDLLEVKVEERTKQLKKAQMERMEQLYRSAEFGRLSAGIFHDLINPLTALSLNLEQIKDVDGKELTNTRIYLGQAIATTKRMENFIMAVRKQIAMQAEQKMFSLTEEIRQIIQLFSYQAKKAGVEIVFFPTENIQTFGDSVKFGQIISNLLCNAIDAYGDIEQFGKRREVLVNLLMQNGLAALTVQDWGKGIASEILDKIFEPFFTTKTATKDLGIGLSIIKSIIEKDFAGAIKVESKPDQGTIFTVVFPKKQPPLS